AGFVAEISAEIHHRSCRTPRDGPNQQAPAASPRVRPESVVTRAREFTSADYFFLLFNERINAATALISSPFSFSLKAGIGVPFLPLVMTSIISSSLIESCTLGSVKSGVLTAGKPFPSGPWHIEQRCLKMAAPSGSGAA